jgi:hypothetical protein
MGQTARGSCQVPRGNPEGDDHVPFSGVFFAAAKCEMRNARCERDKNRELRGYKASGVLLSSSQVTAVLTMLEPFNNALKHALRGLVGTLPWAGDMGGCLRLHVRLVSCTAGFVCTTPTRIRLVPEALEQHASTRQRPNKPCCIVLAPPWVHLTQAHWTARLCVWGRLQVLRQLYVSGSPSCEGPYDGAGGDGGVGERYVCFVCFHGGSQSHGSTGLVVVGTVARQRSGLAR